MHVADWLTCGSHVVPRDVGVNDHNMVQLNGSLKTDRRRASDRAFGTGDRLEVCTVDAQLAVLGIRYTY